MIGSLDILNCGHGHLSVKFDKASEGEVDKARRMIRDMLKRGYALFIDMGGGELHRVKDFDPEKDEYILKDPIEISGEEPSHEPEPNPKQELSHDQDANPPAEKSDAPTQTKREPLRETKRSRRAPLRESRVTGVGPTAGG